jgi:hypothetical protein
MQGMKKRVEAVQLGVSDALTAPGRRRGRGRVQRRGRQGRSLTASSLASARRHVREQRQLLRGSGGSGDSSNS